MENATSLNKVTLLETVGSQTRRHLLYSELPDRVDGVNKREVKAVFEVMANLAGAIDGTSSMMEDVDDNAPMGARVENRLKWALMEMESRSGVRTELMTMPSPRRHTPWVGLE